MYKLTRVSLIYLSVIILAACTTVDNTDTPVVGVKIYSYDGDYDGLFEIWKNHGINTVLASPELLGDEIFREKLDEEKISSFLIFPVFFDAEALEDNPGLYAITSEGEPAIDDWVKFVCPSREDFRQRKIEEARRYIESINPDGISIDFIRYFVFWETVFPDFTLDSLPETCYDEHCLEKFQQDKSINIPDTLTTVSEIASWIEQYQSVEWTEWKCKQITTMIEQIVHTVKNVKPEILINVHLVPWRIGDFDDAILKIAGQDVTAIKEFADYLSPMTYSHMVKQEPAWIHSVVIDVYERSSGSVIPSIQVSRAYLDEPLTTDEFSECIEQALLPPSLGVIFWSWDHLAADPEKLKILKEYFQ